MKPAAFKYFAPHTVDDALDLLATHGAEGKILAAGQSLVPAMNFRLARPTSLIDINRIHALDYVREEGGELRIGALARHARFEAPVTTGVLSTFLPRVARHVGHLSIRSRGTLCGSIAHADPASEWCLLAATLEAELILLSRHRQRNVRPTEYFVGALTTLLEPDELLAEIRLPLLDGRWRQDLPSSAGGQAISRSQCAPPLCGSKRAASLKRGSGLAAPPTGPHASPQPRRY
jgi:aerobic carbon-monoxide dehydrogenase medium subunit